MLDEFRKRHLHATGMSREIFVYQCAKEASKRTVVAEFVDSFFNQLKRLNGEAEPAEPAVEADEKDR